MPRPPSPWFKKSHGAWYVKLDRKEVRLGTDRADAFKAFHRLMAQRPRFGPHVPKNLTIAELGELWLTARDGQVKPSTFGRYLMYTQAFKDFYPRLRAEDLQPYHVEQWLQAHAWNSSTRNLATTIVKMILKWGKDQGYLATNPIASVKTPPMLRRAPVTAADMDKFLAHVRCPEFRDYLELALETGCRPGELRTLDASRIDQDARRAIVTGKRGERTIFLSDRACAILARLVKRWPEGPVLRNTWGRPWLDRTLIDHCRRINAKAGTKIVPYHTRGVFATRVVRKVDSLIAAKLLGHTDPRMLAKHYEGLEDADLLDAVNRVSASEDTETRSGAGRARRRGTA